MRVVEALALAAAVAAVVIRLATLAEVAAVGVAAQEGMVQTVATL
jgi:hypothetical protein